VRRLSEKREESLSDSKWAPNIDNEGSPDCIGRDLLIAIAGGVVDQVVNSSLLSLNAGGRRISRGAVHDIDDGGRQVATANMLQ
jgi:hypothetical protein